MTSPESLNPTRYWEDLPVEAVVDLGDAVVSEEEIVAFARRYDPQPFHTDTEMAREFRYGGLIASGWHTSALYMRLLATVGGIAGAGSPGVDKLRWPAPVRPGDTLRARMTVISSRPSRRHADIGVVRWRAEMMNQRGQLVLTFLATSLIRRRQPARGGRRGTATSISTRPGTTSSPNSRGGSGD